MIGKALVACEESQVVCKALRAKGWEAYSCDILPCSGGHPEWHIQDDINYVLSAGYTKTFFGISFNWDLIILHPPCTKIAVSGNRWYGYGTEKHTERIQAVSWTLQLWNAAKDVCNLVGLENPVGVLNKYTMMPKPQYIQPWEFGHGETKKTGLWLYGLPELKPTDIVEGREQKIWKMPPSKDRAKLRSKTYSGIAQAMADQWTDFYLKTVCGL